MVLYVLTDERNRIISAADEGFHLGPAEQAADFEDELVEDGHVEIYDERMIPLFVLEDGVAVERSQEEIDADYVPPKEPEPDSGNLDSRVTALEEQLASYEAAYAQGVQEA